MPARTIWASKSPITSPGPDGQRKRMPAGGRAESIVVSAHDQASTGPVIRSITRSPGLRCKRLIQRSAVRKSVNWGPYFLRRAATAVGFPLCGPAMRHRPDTVGLSGCTAPKRPQGRISTRPSRRRRLILPVRISLVTTRSRPSGASQMGEATIHRSCGKFRTRQTASPQPGSSPLDQAPHSCRHPPSTHRVGDHHPRPRLSGASAEPTPRRYSTNTSRVPLSGIGSVVPPHTNPEGG